jgi:hypothetical protein
MQDAGSGDGGVSTIKDHIVGADTMIPPTPGRREAIQVHEGICMTLLAKIEELRELEVKPGRILPTFVLKQKG